MKKILFMLIFIIISCQAESLKIDTLEIKNVNYESGEFGSTTFRILCINGYVWLQSGVSGSRTLSQMFQNNIPNANAQAIKCENEK